MSFGKFDFLYSYHLFVPQPNSFDFIYEPAILMCVRKFLLYDEIDFFCSYPLEIVINIPLPHNGILIFI